MGEERIGEIDFFTIVIIVMNTTDYSKSDPLIS